MSGAPEPAAPGAPAADDDSQGRSWIGSLFASGDRNADSLIVALAVSIVAFWILCGYQIVQGREISSPLALGTGVATILAAFAGGKTIRDKFSGGPPLG